MSRIIKRYDNRKLYDTENRQYISLEEIAALIRNGVDVQVIDKSTEADITIQTLTQVIFEEGKKGRNPFSKEVLHDVIRWSNNIIDEGIQQMRHGLDQIPDTLNKLFHSEEKDDMARLKKRIESLEDIINKLASQQPSEQTQKNSSE